MSHMVLLHLMMILCWEIMTAARWVGYRSQIRSLRITHLLMLLMGE